MSEKRPSPLANLPHLLREQIEELPQRWRQWREGLREDPGLLWRSPGVRIAGLVLLAILVIASIRWAIGGLTPGGGSPALEQATPWATLYVACANPVCRADYATQKPMDFKQWPVKCDKCGALLVYRATRCPDCRRWFAAPPGSPVKCPFCAEKAASKPVKNQPPKPRARTDNDEDPW